MPPTGVSISTCLSSPFCCFFTFTLQAGKDKVTRIAIPKTKKPMSCNLILRMRRTSFGDLRRTFEAGAALRNVWNGDWQMAVNRNFAEESLDSRDFRDARIGKRAYIIFDLGKIAGQIRIPHGDDGGLSSSMIEQLLQQKAGGVGHCHRIAHFPRRRNDVDGRNHSLRLVD